MDTGASEPGVNSNGESNDADGVTARAAPVETEIIGVGESDAARRPAAAESESVDGGGTGDEALFKLPKPALAGSHCAAVGKAASQQKRTKKSERKSERGGPEADSAVVVVTDDGFETSATASCENGESASLPATTASPADAETDGGGARSDAKTAATGRAPPAPPPADYEVPSWSGPCDREYSIEVIKNGALVQVLSLRPKPYYIVGRLPSCDLPMEHPSLSRRHAVLQYCVAGASPDREEGWYIYDTGSAHGTYVNDVRIEKRVYTRLRVGCSVKLGGSTRVLTLQGPPDEQEERPEVSLEELKRHQDEKIRRKEAAGAALVARRAAAGRAARAGQAAVSASVDGDNDAEGDNDAGGCSWGLDDADPIEEDPNAVNPFAEMASNEELYIDDPKKALSGWFEREGFDPPEYVVTDEGRGKFRCTIELPLDSPTGRPIVAEVAVTGKKKEAHVQCALEACRILDRHGVLRQAKHESRKRKAKNWEEADYYDSDEDTFLDRTGEIERKRIDRMMRFGKDVPGKTEALTYDTLKESYANIDREIGSIQAQLTFEKEREAQRKAAAEAAVDDLDAYMQSIKSGAMDATTKVRLKKHLVELISERARLERLIEVAKPNSLPSLKMQVHESTAAAALETRNRLAASSAAAAAVPSTTDAAVRSVQPADDVSRQGVKETAQIESADCNDIPISDSGGRGSENSSETNDSSEVTPLSSKGQQLEANGVSHTSGMEHITQDAAVVVTTSEAAKPDRKSQGPYGHDRRTRKMRKAASGDPVYPENDPDYAVWVPPADQTGDGKTKLNERFGY